MFLGVYILGVWLSEKPAHLVQLNNCLFTIVSDECILLLSRQKRKREEAERLRMIEEERLRKAMAAGAARREAKRLHKVCLHALRKNEDSPLNGQYHAILSNTMKLEMTLFG